MKNKKEFAIIFDFDGTIGNTYQAVLDLFDKFAKEFGTKHVDGYDIEELRGMEMGEIIKYFGVPFWKIPTLVKKVRADIVERMKIVPVVDGIREVLDELKRQEYVLGMMTGNAEDNIREFLQRNNINHFEFISAGVGIKGKPRALKKLIKENNLDKEKTFYVGDEVRDIKASRKAGIKVIAVTWGLNSEKFLRENQPDYLVNSPRDIVTIVEGI